MRVVRGAILSALLIPYALLMTNPWVPFITGAGPDQLLMATRIVVELLAPSAGAILAYLMAHRRGFWPGALVAVLAGATAQGLAVAVNLLAAALHQTSGWMWTDATRTSLIVAFMVVVALIPPGLGAWMRKRDRVVVHEILGDAAEAEPGLPQDFGMA